MKKQKSQKKRNAFSLVEVLISAAILSVAVVAIVTIVRKGRDIQVADKHRQEARAILNARFEKKYGDGNFNTVHEGTTVDTVEIDPRESNPLNGVITTIIDSVHVVAAEATAITTKRITMTLSWQDFEDEMDSIIMSKWLCR